MLCPAWLLRRSVYEPGQRLAAAGRLDDAAHVFELTVEEIGALLRGARSPSREEAAERAADRAAAALATPPANLGPPQGPPPSPTIFPRAMGELTGAAMLMTRTIFAPAAKGHGVGATPATGRAVVVRDAAEAMDRVEPGDIIVTTGTNPGFNAVLAIAGGLVLETGGLLSHGAIAARELGIPAVVGLPGATSRFPDGATITVDPTVPSVVVATT
jgi:pyruvate,water dikinase